MGSRGAGGCIRGITTRHVGMSARSNERKEDRQMSGKKESRAAKWVRLAGEAVAAIEELKDIQSDFESWRDNLPENLQSSPVGEKLDAVCDLDLDGALDTLSEAEGVDLPLGFGRD